MALPKIVEKLNRELTEPILSERQVVYVLAEIRKLMELEKKKDVYASLNFFCNWALHSRLTSSSIGRGMVTAFDRSAQFHVQMKSVPSGQQVPNLDWTLLEQIEQAIELPVFYDELKAFATAYGITGNPLMDDMEWISFLRHYAGVIEDSFLHDRKS